MGIYEKRKEKLAFSMCIFSRIFPISNLVCVHFLCLWKKVRHLGIVKLKYFFCFRGATGKNIVNFTQFYGIFLRLTQKTEESRKVLKPKIFGGKNIRPR